jgi:hypothetical protein
MCFRPQVCSVLPITPVPTKAPTVRGTAPTQEPTQSPITNAPLIRVIFTDPDDVPSAFRDALDFAVNKWNSIISNNLPHVPLPEGLTDASEIGCPAEYSFPSDMTELTGLTIFASVKAIDKKGGTLAQATACAFSSPNGSIEFGTLRPRVGWMSFDVDDLDGIIRDGSIDRVVLHEMGHVLGIGVLWPQLGLVTDPPTASSQSSDPRYTGQHGMAGYEAVGGPLGESDTS